VRHLLVDLVFGGIGAEQLAQRVVDLEPLEADGGAGEQDQKDQRGDPGVADRLQADALDAER
jgi:hypothetical protein